MDFKLEVVPIPVTDVDRAKSFYADQAGFHVDHDMAFGEDFRVIQLTPPGSACSIVIGKGVTANDPGCIQGLHLVVTDIQAARAALVARGVEMGDVETMGAPGRPNVYYSRFQDPDGNGWTLQQVGD